ncbi:MAG: DUF2934 domain-containing protein [Gammaproteobacteria bacterium]|nr:DUF2934 domain-containing protein [Gammaproteobacteria bacterium]
MSMAWGLPVAACRMAALGPAGGIIPSVYAPAHRPQDSSRRAPASQNPVPWPRASFYSRPRVSKHARARFTAPLRPAAVAGWKLKPVAFAALSASRVTRVSRRSASMPKADHAQARVDVELRRAMISQAAYFRAVKRHIAPGGELDDWLGAEAEINTMLERRTRL